MHLCEITTMILSGRVPRGLCRWHHILHRKLVDACDWSSRFENYLCVLYCATACETLDRTCRLWVRFFLFSSILSHSGSFSTITWHWTMRSVDNKSAILVLLLEAIVFHSIHMFAEMNLTHNQYITKPGLHPKQKQYGGPQEVVVAFFRWFVVVLFLV